MKLYSNIKLLLLPVFNWTTELSDAMLTFVIMLDKQVCLNNTVVWFIMPNNGNYPNFGGFSQTLGVNAKMLGYKTVTICIFGHNYSSCATPTGTLFLTDCCHHILAHPNTKLLVV